MRDKSYGEIAFNAWKSLRNDSVSAVWDAQSQYTQDVWENIAACVITNFHTRQRTLSRQTQAQASAPYPEPDPETHEADEPNPEANQQP